MKRIVLLLMILTSAVRAGDALVVLKSGEAIAANNVVQKGSTVRYTVDGDSGSKSMSAVYKVLPRMTRGKSYSSRKIKDIISEIRKTQTKFPKLKHVTKPLLDEWLTQQKVSGKQKVEGKASLEKRIGAVFDTYDKSERTARDFRKLRSDLDLLQYEDVKGIFKKEIAEVFAPISKAFFAEKVAGLLEAAKDSSLSIRDFKEIYGVGQELLKAGPDTETKTKVNASLEGARRSCLNYQMGRAKKSFGERPTVSSYMKANTILNELQDSVAGPQHQDPINAMRKKMQKALPEHNFDIDGMEDFPISKSDYKHLDKLRNFRLIWGAKTPKRPPALIYPTGSSIKASLKEKKLLRFRAVFRSRPPRQMGYLVRPADLFVPYDKKIKIISGHAELPVEVDFKRLNKGQLAKLKEQITAKSGRMSILIELVEWQRDKGKKTTYNAISNAVPVLVE